MKILIIEDCQVNFGDDRGGMHQSAGDMPDVAKQTATDLVNAGRALYTDRKDDPHKDGRNTASEAILAAARGAKGKPGRGGE